MTNDNTVHDEYEFIEMMDSDELSRAFEAAADDFKKFGLALMGRQFEQQGIAPPEASLVLTTREDTDDVEGHITIALSVKLVDKAEGKPEADPIQMALPLED
jgi:hypothetical protein